MKLQRILVAINDSEPANWAVESAVELAAQLGAQVSLIHVVNRARAGGGSGEGPSAELLAELRRHGQQLLDLESKQIPQTLRGATILREGKPSEEIIAAATEIKAQLVVLGTHGRSRLSHLLLGSTAEAVIRQAPCAVLTVRRKPGNGSADSSIENVATSSTR